MNIVLTFKPMIKKVILPLNERRKTDLKFTGLVGENIIGTIKMRNNIWDLLKMVILFSIAPHLVIALVTLNLLT